MLLSCPRYEQARRTKVVVTSSALILSALLGPFIRSTAEAQAAERHPADRYWVSRIPVPTTIDLGPTSTGRAVSSPPAWWRASTPTITVGALDAPVEAVFGRILDIAADPAGRLYVLDGSTGVVRVFDRLGAFEQSIGGPGNGPGEFRQPKAIAVDEEGLLVADGYGYMHRFVRDTKVGMSTRLKFRSRNKIASEIWDFCILGSTLVVHGAVADEPGYFHTLTLSGSRQKSFGQLYQSGVALTDVTIVKGRIECSRENKTIVYAATATGDLRGFFLDGTEVWHSRVAGLTPVDIQERPGGLKVTFPKDGYHSLTGVAMAPDGCALIQIQPRHPSSRGAVDDGLPFTVGVNVRTGRADFVALGIPKLWLAGKYAFALRDDPFPLIEVREVNAGRK